MCEIEDLGVGLEEGGLGILRKFEDIGAKKKILGLLVCVCVSLALHMFGCMSLYMERELTNLLRPMFNSNNLYLIEFEFKHVNSISIQPLFQFLMPLFE